MVPPLFAIRRTGQPKHPNRQRRFPLREFISRQMNRWDSLNLIVFQKIDGGISEPHDTKVRGTTHEAKSLCKRDEQARGIRFGESSEQRVWSSGRGTVLLASLVFNRHKIASQPSPLRSSFLSGEQISHFDRLLILLVLHISIRNQQNGFEEGWGVLGMLYKVSSPSRKDTTWSQPSKHIVGSLHDGV